MPAMQMVTEKTKHPFLFLKNSGVTSVNRTLQVSGAKSYNTSSVHCTVCSPKGCRSHSPSGHNARLQVRSLVRAHTEGNRSMFLSFSLSLNKNISFCED